MEEDAEAAPPTSDDVLTGAAAPLVPPSADAPLGVVRDRVDEEGAMEVGVEDKQRSIRFSA